MSERNKNSEKLKFRGSGVVIPTDIVTETSVLLAHKIQQEYAEQELELPRLAFVARSSWHIGPTIMGALGIGSANVLNINTQRVSEDPKLPLEQRFMVGQMPTRENVEGQDVLIVDAACRSGDTLNFAYILIKDLGPLSLRTAVVYDSMPGAGESRNFDPDYYAVKKPALGYVTTGWELEEMKALVESRKPANSDLL